MPSPALSSVDLVRQTGITGSLPWPTGRPSGGPVHSQVLEFRPWRVSGPRSLVLRYPHLAQLVGLNDPARPDVERREPAAPAAIRVEAHQESQVEHLARDLGRVPD